MDGKSDISIFYVRASLFAYLFVSTTNFFIRLIVNISMKYTIGLAPCGGICRGPGLLVTRLTSALCSGGNVRIQISGIANANTGHVTSRMRDVIMSIRNVWQCCFFYQWYVLGKRNTETKHNLKKEQQWAFSPYLHNFNL